MVARGARLRLRAADGGLHGEASAARIHATDDAAELGVQDYVIVAVKTGSLAAAMPGLRPLLGPNTVVVPAMNGVPWWFFQGFGGPLDGMRLEGVDPQGAIAAVLLLERVLGCAVYPTSYIAEPGRIQHTGRWDLHLGEPAAAPGAAPSARLLKLQALLAQACFQCKASADIRSDIWLKLIGNASFNPVSALSCATLDRMLDDPELYALRIADGGSHRHGLRAGAQAGGDAETAAGKRPAAGRGEVLDAAGRGSRPHARIRGAHRRGAGRLARAEHAPADVGRHARPDPPARPPSGRGPEENPRGSFRALKARTINPRPRSMRGRP
ncbi:MAG: 2-dehydropantoate 2-reductase [Candidatus Protistobacter heckmanni]|nr:2-dehydropantoate 2-reductase [Candidatus Protistobacter heckmanni]